MKFAPGRSPGTQAEPDDIAATENGDPADSENLRPEVRAIRDQALRQAKAFASTSGTFGASGRRVDRSANSQDPEIAPKPASERGALNSATIAEAQTPPSRQPSRLPPHDSGYGPSRKAPSAHPPEGVAIAPAPARNNPDVISGLNKDDGPTKPAVPLSADPKHRPDNAAPASGNVPAGSPPAPPPGSTIRITPPASEDPPIASSGNKTPIVDVYSPNESLTRRLDRRVQESPQDLAAQLDHLLLTFLKNEPAFSAPSAAGLTREDRELLGALIDGIANFRAALAADGSALIPRKAKPLLDMADRIRAQSVMSLPTLALCSKVSGYGNYEPLNPRFRAGIDQPVIIYCEIDNFASRMNDRQLYETRLSLEVTLYTADGSPIWSDKNPVPPDVSRNKRHDFFVIKHMVLPRSLGLGRYLLKVSITDEGGGGRVAENQLWITMSAQ